MTSTLIQSRLQQSVKLYFQILVIDIAYLKTPLMRQWRTPVANLLARSNSGRIRLKRESADEFNSIHSGRRFSTVKGCILREYIRCIFFPRLVDTWIQRHGGFTSAIKTERAATNFRGRQEWKETRGSVVDDVVSVYCKLYSWALAGVAAVFSKVCHGS